MLIKGQMCGKHQVTVLGVNLLGFFPSFLKSLWKEQYLRVERGCPSFLVKPVKLGELVDPYVI